MRDELDGRAMRRLLSIAAEGGDGAPPPALPERFEVVRELGRGGMGVVYECEDRKLARRCAVKTIGVAAGADVRARFAREAQAAARLRHPHIAAIFDATEDYISMQLVDGAPIDRLPNGDVRELVGVVRDAARALHHAHEQGIVHRDVKPSNLLVEDGHVLVVDFGLAKAIDHDSSLSMSGAMLGTPAFMAPEQALGRVDVDARCDVYGLGATLFTCLRGAPPFVADDLPTLLRDVVDRDAPRLGVDRDLDVVVAKCLHKQAAHRYESAAELADDLDRWLRHEPIRARPLSRRYRLQKVLQRQKALWRAAGVAIALTAVVLVPIALRESAARRAASEAVALADRANALVEEAAFHSRLGDTHTAHQVLDRGIAQVEAFLRDNEVPRAHFLLSRLLRLRGRPKHALRAIDRALQLDDGLGGGLGDARYERGLLLASMPTLDDAQRATAIEDLTVGLERRSELTTIEEMIGRGELLRLRGRHEEAIDVLKGVLEYDPLNTDVRLSLSRAAVAIGDAELARHYSSTAFDLQRGFGSFFSSNERNRLPESMYGLDAALVDFSNELRDDQGWNLATAFRGLVQLRRALRLQREDQLEPACASAAGAVRDYDETLLARDDLVGAYNNRGVCRLVHAELLAATGRTADAARTRKQAIADFDEALQRAPLLAAAHANRGVAELQLARVVRALGRPVAHHVDAAKQSLQRAIAMTPTGWVHRRMCTEQLASAERMN